MFNLLPETFFNGVDNILRAVWQYETCPTTGKEHTQGYIMLSKRMRLNQVKALLQSDQAHLEAARGTPRANMEYCTKETSRSAGPFYFPSESDWQDIKGSGKRSDLDDLKDAIDNGASIAEVANEHFASYLKFSNGIRSYMALRAQPRVNQEMDVKFWYGATGTGKTKGVFDLFDHNDVYVVMRPTNGSLYYDGYIGQKCILFDDFYGWAPLSHMLNIMDRYPMNLKVHGGMVPVLASTSTIIITSNNDLLHLYKDVDNDEKIKAFRRRIKEVKQFHNLMQ